MMSPSHANICSRRSSMDDRYRLLTLCAIRSDGHSIDWSLLAREAQLWQGLDRLEEGVFHEDSAEAAESLPLLLLRSRSARRGTRTSRTGTRPRRARRRPA